MTTERSPRIAIQGPCDVFRGRVPVLGEPMTWLLCLFGFHEWFVVEPPIERGRRALWYAKGRTTHICCRCPARRVVR